MMRHLKMRLPNPQIVSRDRLLHVDSGNAQPAKTVAPDFLNELGWEVRACSFPSDVRAALHVGVGCVAWIQNQICK